MSGRCGDVRRKISTVYSGQIPEEQHHSAQDGVRDPRRDGKRDGLISRPDLLCAVRKSGESFHYRGRRAAGDGENGKCRNGEAQYQTRGLSGFFMV